MFVCLCMQMNVDSISESESQTTRMRHLFRKKTQRRFKVITLKLKKDS